MNVMYTEDLIKEIKELYPTSFDMHKHAKNGTAWLGRYLDDGCPTGIAIKDVLNATSLQELQAEARIAQRKIDLYKKWQEQDPRKQ